RVADGDVPSGVYVGDGGPDGGFGGPVQVGDRSGTACQVVGEFGGQGLAPDQDVQPAYRVGVFVDQGPPQGGGGLHDGGRGAGQGAGVAGGVAVDQDRGGPPRQGEVDLEQGDVEGDGGDARPAVSGV